jgi:hypothetical protein
VVDYLAKEGAGGGLQCYLTLGSAGKSLNECCYFSLEADFIIPPNGGILGSPVKYSFSSVETISDSLVLTFEEA